MMIMAIMVDDCHDYDDDDGKKEHDPLVNIFPTDWWLSMRKSSLGWSVSQKRCFLIIFLILTLILGFLKRDHDSPLISFTN